jgi:hypothetical protein
VATGWGAACSSVKNGSKFNCVIILCSRPPVVKSLGVTHAVVLAVAGRILVPPDI